MKRKYVDKETQYIFFCLLLQTLKQSNQYPLDHIEGTV